MARWKKTLDLSDWWEGLPLDDGTAVSLEESPSFREGRVSKGG